MPSRPINFRLGEKAYAKLIEEAREGESASKTAQRLLTMLLTGQKRELGLKIGGRPTNPMNVIIPKIKSTMGELREDIIKDVTPKLRKLKREIMELKQLIAKNNA